MSSNLPKSEPSFVRISALASKIDQINKIKALYNMFGHIFFMFKGQLISKANCQAEDPPKKRTNEFVFTTMRSFFGKN